MRKGGIGSHTLPNRGATDDWITPPHVVTALQQMGEFDLDPCECLQQPWKCAQRGYTILHDGLAQEWIGSVYCNPPYGDAAWPFLRRLAHHGDGVGLLFGRTETRMFREHIWEEADAILFLAGRLTFHRPDGSKGAGNSGGPSVLVAYGEQNVDRLRRSGLPGALVTKWECRGL